MSTMDFPTNPVNGQQYVVGNVTYTWTTTKNAWIVTTNVIPGAVGPQGYQGVQGATGFQGFQGAQGVQGHQGVQGPQGIDTASNRVLKAGDTMTGNLNVNATIFSQNVIPVANVVYSLGTSTQRFKDLWLSNSTIYLGDAQISATGANVMLPGQLTTMNGITFADGTTQTTKYPLAINVVNTLSVDAIKDQHYLLTGAGATSVTLPAAVNVGDFIMISVENGLLTNIILRNGHKIKGVSDNVTLDIANVTVQLRYISSNTGWIVT